MKCEKVVQAHCQKNVKSFLLKCISMYVRLSNSLLFILQEKKYICREKIKLSKKNNNIRKYIDYKRRD
jgi:hypothetical protein